MSVETNKQVVLAFLAVYNAHDWERFGNFLAEDIIFQIPSLPEPQHGISTFHPGGAPKPKRYWNESHRLLDR